MSKRTTSAGGVVVSPDQFVLIVKQRNGSWSLPKGHVEEGEDLIATARREIFEESGLKSLVLLRHLGTYTRFRHGDRNIPDAELKTIHMFHFLAKETNLSPRDSDNPEARWVPRNEVADMLTYTEDKEFFISVINLI